MRAARLVLLAVTVCVISFAAAAAHAVPLLGTFGSPGSGTGQFGGPDGIAASHDGFVYVADTYNSRVQKFTSTGTYVSSFGSLGSGNGQFSRPYGIDVDAGGNVYVGDLDRKDVQVFASDGTWLRKFGAGVISQPFGLWVGDDGTVYVTDRPARVIRRFTSSGITLSAWGPTIGPITLQFPQNIEGDHHGNLYVSDGNAGFRVVVLSDAGSYESVIGGYWIGNPTGAALASGRLFLTAYNLNLVNVIEPASHQLDLTLFGPPGGFNSPLDCATVGDSILYVLDTGNGRVAMYRVTVPASPPPPPQYLSSFGSPGAGQGQFGGPDGIAVSDDGYLYVADTYNSRVQKFTADGTYMSSFGSNGIAPGQFQRPYGIDVDAAGNIYVGDLDRHDVQKFAADGTWLATIGAGQLAQPFGLWVSDDGILYVTDRPAAVVRRYHSADGSPLPPLPVDQGLSFPQNIEGDNNGTLYLSDGDGDFTEMEMDTNGHVRDEQYGVGNPTGAALTADRLFVTEYNLNQLGIFDRSSGLPYPPITDGGGVPKYSPLDAAIHGNDLYVLDTANNRVVRYALGGGGGSPPQVTVVGPNGGEQLTVGQMAKLSWTAVDDGTVASVAIDVSRDGGASYLQIASGLANSGTYTWTVTGPTSTHCLLRVRATDDQNFVGSDVSDANWTIAGGSPPQVTVVAPNGGEQLTVGTTASLQWSASDDGSIASIAIDLSRDGGSTYGPIATGLANSGSYAWMVSGPASAHCRLRVRATDNDSLTSNDASDADWSIVPPPQPPTVSLIRPNGGEVYEIGGLASIHWSAADSNGTVTSIDLAVSRDGGPYQVIATGLPDNGLYSWTVDGPASNHCRMVVTATNNDGLTARDTSDADWRIQPQGPGIVTTFLGSFGTCGPEPGQFGGPDGIAVSDDGFVYVADTYHSRVEKFTLTGTFVSAFGSNGTGNGQFLRPYGIDVDADGNVYVGDLDRHDVQKFTASGTWVLGFGSDLLSMPFGLWVSDDGLVYVTDRPAQKIFRFATDGTPLGFWGPILAGGVPLNAPENIEGDGAGRLYVSDEASRVYVLDTSGAALSTWGPGWAGIPTGSALALGHLFLTDYSYNVVDLIDLATGQPDGQIADAGGSSLNVPLDCATVGDSLLLVLDTGNCRVLRYQIVGHPQVVVTSPAGGEQWLLGSHQSLSWSLVDIGNVTSTKLQISHDGGAHYGLIASGDVTSPYAWTVSGDPSNDCLLRVTVTDAHGQTTVGVSNPFAIIDPSVPALLEDFETTSGDGTVEIHWQLGSSLTGWTTTLQRAPAVKGPYVAIDAPWHVDGRAVTVSDETVEPGRTYWYRIFGRSATGATATFGPVSGTSNAIRVLALESPNPSPVRDDARIGFALPHPGHVRLTVIDVQGREVARLVDGDLPAGRHDVQWRDGGAKNLASGIYFLRLDAGHQGVLHRRLALAR